MARKVSSVLAAGSIFGGPIARAKVPTVLVKDVTATAEAFSSTITTYPYLVQTKSAKIARLNQKEPRGSVVRSVINAEMAIALPDHPRAAATGQIEATFKTTNWFTPGTSKGIIVEVLSGSRVIRRWEGRLFGHMKVKQEKTWRHRFNAKDRLTRADFEAFSGIRITMLGDQMRK